MANCIILRRLGSLLLSLFLSVGSVYAQGISVDQAQNTQQVLGTRDLLADIESAKERLLSVRSDIDLTLEEFKMKYYQLFLLDPRVYDVEKVRKNTNTILVSLHSFQELLREQFSNWPHERLHSTEFQNYIRAMMRAVHNMIDLVSEASLGNEKTKKGQAKISAFQGGLPWTYTWDNRPLLAQDFQSGDVLLMRGGSAVSAAIARVTDVNSLFSHAAIVYVDPQTGKKYVVEALTEKGATINSLEYALNHGAPRMLALRHHDTIAAAKGSEILYQIVKASIENKRTFKYDFTMSGRLPDVSTEDVLKYVRGSNDPELVQKLSNYKVFCSLMVKWAFHIGSEGKYTLPEFSSGMNAKNRAFLERLGIQPETRSVFAPADLELDPNFKVIGDFREPRRTSGLRVDDFIFDKIFEWMEKHQLQFQESMFFETVGWVSNRASNMDLIRKAASNMGLAIAPHIPPKVISSVIMLEKMRGILLGKLNPLMIAYEEKNGMSMPPRLILEHLEKIYRTEPGLLKYLAPPQMVNRSCKSTVGR